MKLIKLYGKLGKKFGKVHLLDVSSPAEAIRALKANFPDFINYIQSNGTYKVTLAGKESLSVDQLSLPFSAKESISIVPVVQGSGKGGAGQIILGAALIAITYGAATAFAPIVPGSMAATAVSIGYGMGVSLILGGISQILFPVKQPEAQSYDTPTANGRKASFYFNGAVNTSAQGNPVPILYGGPLIIGSQEMSFGLSTEQLP